MIGLRVAELDGGRLSFRGALVRNLARFVDAAFPLQLFLGMTTLMTSRRRQRLGDVLARTMVVEDRPVPAEPPIPPRSEPKTVERR